MLSAPAIVRPRHVASHSAGDLARHGPATRDHTYTHTHTGGKTALTRRGPSSHLCSPPPPWQLARFVGIRCHSSSDGGERGRCYHGRPWAAGTRRDNTDPFHQDRMAGDIVYLRPGANCQRGGGRPFVPPAASAAFMPSSTRVYSCSWSKPTGVLLRKSCLAHRHWAG